jgi:hypothetical protein
VNDETPMDLQLLEPDETPDVVRGAMRRFRWRVVLLTVVAIITTASLTAWGVAEYLGSRRLAEMIARAEPAKRAIMEDHEGAYMCHTPTFEFRRYEVALLRATRMSGGGWALHLVVHGTAPLASGTGRFMNFVPLGPGARPEQIPAQAGTTWADAFVAIPPAMGDRFHIQLWDLRSRVLGTFTVDTGTLNCDF